MLFSSISRAAYRTPRASVFAFALMLPLQSVTQSATPSAPTIHVTSRLVLLDATVVDAKGQPVTGLTAQDFQVLEDKTPQRIVTFEAPEEHLLPADSTKPGVTLDVHHPEQFGAAPVNVLVLDEMNTHFADASYGVRSLRSYLEHQPAVLPQATALFAVNNTHFQLLQSYTADRDLLLRSLAAHKVVYAWKLESSKSIGDEVADRLDSSLAALEQIAQNVGSLKMHKNILWIGAGFPSIDPQALTQNSYQMLQNALSHVSDALLDARASLYAIDPTTTAAGMTEVTDETQMAFLTATGGGTGLSTDPFDKSLDFNKLAPLSGGRVVRGLNDVDHQIALSTQLGRSYYTLGYRPQDATEEEHRFRSIRVICTRPGTQVLSRQGYYAGLQRSPAQTRDTVQYDLNNAALAVVPLTGLNVKVTMQPNGFLLHVTSTGLTWLVNGKEQDAKVQVMAVALGTSQKILGHRLLSQTAHASVALHPDVDAQDAAFEIQYDVPSKAKLLRFVVRDAESGRMGTVDVDPKTIHHDSSNDEQ